ncbi:hypothetical protein ACS15_1052 [Ralstonia insidiosa]|uniref:Uncharacterized protein n=1 Tax=Ralstonia insidiosa TaxID=190721 RepID=A0AAC9BE67_9RALS|nr:hypothetical protein ACS15_1052 [Ralstonia insidiosa]
MLPPLLLKITVGCAAFFDAVAGRPVRFHAVRCPMPHDTAPTAFLLINLKSNHSSGSSRRD